MLCRFVKTHRSGIVALLAVSSGVVVDVLTAIFTGLAARMQTRDTAAAGQAAALEDVVPELERLRKLLAGENQAQIAALERFAVEPEVKRLRVLIEEQRAEFDALDFLRLSSDEEFHSNFLAWLLDPLESHGFRERFLSNFLRETGAPSKVQASDWTRAIVIREWANQVDGQDGRLDILILNEPECTLCAIENKIWSSEHSDQLMRYRKALEERYPQWHRHYVFLTPRGTLPYREEEQKYWTATDYKVVLQLVEQTISNTANPVKEDVRTFLRQYAATLRRNIEPDANTNIQQLVRQIYLEHREAIDLIIKYKPDFEEETKEMFRQAIDRERSWVRDSENARIVRFRSADWGQFPSFNTGTGWAQSQSVMTFEIDFRPGCPKLVLMLGPGSDAAIREHIHARIRQYPALFSRSGRELTGTWTGLHDHGEILQPDYLDMWDADTIRADIDRWMESFAENQFRDLNDIIVKCLEEYEKQGQ